MARSFSSQESRFSWTNLARELERVWLNRSSKPFACGWYAVVKRWLMLNRDISCLFILLLNSFPWSVVRTEGRPTTKNSWKIEAKAHAMTCESTTQVSTTNLFQWISHMWCLFGGQGFCPSKFGEIIRYGEDVPISGCWSWAYRPNEIHPYVKPRGFHGNWIKLWSDDIKLFIHLLTLTALCDLQLQMTPVS